MMEPHNPEPLFYYIADAHKQNGDVDSASHYYHQALQGYKDKNHHAGVAAMYNNLGNFYYHRGHIDSCVFYYKSALKFYEDQNDTLSKASAQLNLGIAYKEIGAYTTALEYLLLAVRILENKKETSTLGSCYNAIANIYSRQDDFEKAIAYHKRALTIRQSLVSRKAIASSLNNLGIIYRRQGNYDSALFYLRQSLILKQEEQNSSRIASTLNNIGLVLFNQGKLSEAKEQFEKAFSMRTGNIDLVGQAITLNNLGKVHNAMGQYRRALRFLNSAYNIIEEEGLLEEMADNLALSIETNEALGNTKEALKISMELMEVKDSLLNQEKVESLVEMQTKYETEKKEQFIAVLETQKELQNTEIQLNRLWISILAISVILVIVVGLLIYGRFKSEKRNKRKVETLMQELHHRVKNNLQLLSSIFSLQSRAITDSGALEAVKSSENRVNAMAIIHQKLYSKTEVGHIDGREYFHDLISQLAESFGYELNNGNIIVEIGDFEIDLDQVISLGLIVNELVSNCFKHTFSEVLNPKLYIRIKQAKEDLLIEIQDNGRGFNREDISSNSMGLNIIETLSRQLRATIKWDIDPGVRFNLLMKLN
ncbi:tetratricopeptide repeat protein [Fulvivirgaceae bacterium BMA12]|uniref:Tetratricopeptide repeat protein n=1 Tax=Agaribacillus aureus TaxID=3051825 RepID=A0ABT8LDW8_9BACT|nr:tetratricopeptide repeat protein [Fulvivirgaceae bacterium BMA12]